MHQSAFQVTTIAREIAEVSRKEESRSVEVHQVTRSLSDIAHQVEQRAQAAIEQSTLLENRGLEGIDSVRRNIQMMDETATGVAAASTSIGELEAESAHSRHHRHHSRHRRPDQSPGAECRYRSGPRRRAGPRFCRGGRRSAQLAERLQRPAQEVANIIQGWGCAAKSPAQCRTWWSRWRMDVRGQTTVEVIEGMVQKSAWRPKAAAPSAKAARPRWRTGPLATHAGSTVRHPARKRLESHRHRRHRRNDF